MKLSFKMLRAGWLYAALVILLLGVWRPSDLSVGWTNLRPNLVAELAGILLTLIVVDVYVRSRERARWKAVERIACERLLTAMFQATEWMKFIINGDDFLWEEKRRSPTKGLLYQRELHARFVKEKLIPSLDNLAEPANARFLYDPISRDLQKFSQSVDLLIGHHAERFEPDQIQLLLEAQGAADNLKSFLESWLVWDKAEHKLLDAEFFRSSVPASATAFLDALLKAAEAVSLRYRKG
jgi:hypothetical protein